VYPTNVSVIAVMLNSASGVTAIAATVATAVPINAAAIATTAAAAAAAGPAAAVERY